MTLPDPAAELAELKAAAEAKRAAYNDYMRTYMRGWRKRRKEQRAAGDVDRPAPGQRVPGAESSEGGS